VADDAPTQDHPEETQSSEDQRQALTAPEDDVVADPFAVGDPFSDVAAEEPESRLILETAPEPERADYLPLFVAPQPVQFAAAAAADADDDDEDEDDDDGPDSDDDSGDRPAARRRRRGRRGRGRGRGEQGGDDSDDGDSDDAQTDAKGGDDDSGDDSDDDGGDEDGGAEGATRRRRRRRRRKSGSGDDNGNGNGGSADDPPNTVVHERAPRAGKDKDKDKDSGEIQGISGSTRLEAKRQRRRDGRDAGRRRPPILSEAEFLARREAVERMMVVRDKVRSEPPHEGARYTQIAVM